MKRSLPAHRRHHLRVDRFATAQQIAVRRDEPMTTAKGATDELDRIN